MVEDGATDAGGVYYEQRIIHSFYYEQKIIHSFYYEQKIIYSFIHSVTVSQNTIERRLFREHSEDMAWGGYFGNRLRTRDD